MDFSNLPNYCAIIPKFSRSPINKCSSDLTDEPWGIFSIFPRARKPRSPLESWRVSLSMRPFAWEVAMDSPGGAGDIGGLPKIKWNASMVWWCLISDFFQKNMWCKHVKTNYASLGNHNLSNLSWGSHVRLGESLIIMSWICLDIHWFLFDCHSTTVQRRHSCKSVPFLLWTHLKVTTFKITTILAGSLCAKLEIMAAVKVRGWICLSG